LQRGFVEAPVIIQDEMEKDVGGGVCQVATTLHAAAVHGLLEIVRRRSHSRPSGYAPLGLDATVIDREVDLRIKNPYETPLMIHAFLPSRYAIRVELLGLDPPARVEHRYAVIETQDFHRRVYTKTELGPDTVKLKQKGILGYDIVSVVDISYPDGRTDRKRYKSKYWPVPEVFWVGPHVDPSALPPLPERATHVVIDGKGKHPDGQDPAETGAPYLDGDLRPTG
jgi:VanW like protein